MLRRFHEKHAHSRNEPSKTQTYADIRRELSSRRVDYAKRHQKSKPMREEEVPEATFECFKTETFLFQGVVRGRLPSGEGVLMLRSGTVVFGNWREGLLDGRAVVFTPFGGRILASFSLGKLSGWVIAFYGSQVIRCALYYENRVDGERLTFDEGEKMWVAARVGTDGGMVSIVHAEKGVRAELPSFVADEQLKELLERYVVMGEKFLVGGLIDQQQITLTTSYIGFVDEQGRPCGLGCVYGGSEMYSGNFFEGVLQHYGRMLFGSGDVYQGELLAGSFWGRGVYYSAAKNTTSILVSDEAEQHLESEFAGYVMIDMVPPIGRAAQGVESGIRGEALRQLVESLQPYYLREFGMYKKRKHRRESNASMYGHSEDINIQIRDEKQIYGKDRMKEDADSPQFRQVSSPPQRWLNFGFNEENELGLRKSQSLDKREAAARRKQGFDVKVHGVGGEFESVAIRQNVNAEESEGYKKNAPQKTKIMQEIPFGKGLKNEERSNEFDESRGRGANRQELGLGKQKGAFEASETESYVSNNSKKLEAILEKNKSTRKKIFY